MKFSQVKYLLCILALCVFTFGCKKKNTQSKVDSFQEYFDTTPGRYIEYAVTEINHDENNSIKHDTQNYFLRIQIEDTIFDNLGRINRKYVRYKRFSSNESWTISDVWMTIIEGNNAELIEENQRVIKLKFPVNDFTNWNANIFNTLDALDCFYENIHENKVINSLSFDSTITVNQGSERNLIRYFNKYEIYAKHIGMIYKYYKDLNISNFDTLDISSGKELYFKPIQFGIQ